jgi:hypothetical protein
MKVKSVLLYILVVVGCKILEGPKMQSGGLLQTHE